MKWFKIFQVEMLCALCTALCRIFMTKLASPLFLMCAEIVLSPIKPHTWIDRGIAATTKLGSRFIFLDESNGHLAKEFDMGHCTFGTETLMKSECSNGGGRYGVDP